MTHLMSSETHNRLGAFRQRVFTQLYKCYWPMRIWRMRKQQEIHVAFVLGNLGAWKTEGLYKLMLQHPRFVPMLYIGPTKEENDYENLKNYCVQKGYSYTDLDFRDSNIFELSCPDIIFLQKHYGHNFPNLKTTIKHRKTLFCYVIYGFHSSIEDWSCNTPALRASWQVYYENNHMAKQYAGLVNHIIPNSYATGLPMMDELLVSKENVPDQWKKHAPGKKRIIYAPHHSINPENWWQSSTFLDMGEAMLELAEKYSGKVQWAFKPHPLLRGKLNKIWGKQRTDDYYRRWSESEWSQFESGKYLGLFKHSDAMIHDCGSFIMEYLYTGNPVMYMMKNDKLDSTWNDGYKQALSMHYHGWTVEDIENFIRNVIDGHDPMSSDRGTFIAENMTPPNGVSASQNIIDCILYANKAKQMLQR